MRQFHLCFLLALFLFSTGCSSVIQSPTATVANARLGDITGDALTLNLDVDVTNPNAFDLPLGKSDYALTVAGVQLLSGSAKPTGAIPASGSSRVVMPVSIRFDDLLNAKDAIVTSGGNLPFELTGSLGFTGGATALDRAFGKGPRLPLKYKGTLPLKDALNNPSALARSSAARSLAAALIKQVWR